MASIPPELGATGLISFGGRVDAEEWHRLLKGDRAVTFYGEMATDVVCGSGYNLLSLLNCQASTRVIPAEVETPTSLEAAELLRTCLGDMTHTWDAFRREANSVIPHGWALMEMVFKERRGPGGAIPSRFNDGKIGIHKLPLRKQETRMRWVLDQSGDATAFVQAAPGRAPVTIPLSRCIHFRMGGRGSNPEGLSFFRNAVVEYNHKKHVMTYEGIGIEKDVTGMPDMQVPPAIMAATSGEELAIKNAIITNLEQIKNHQQSYMMRPCEVDEENKSTGYAYKLLGSPGAKQFDTDKVITRCNKLMAMALNTEVQQLGMNAVGSYALADSKTNTLAMAVGTILDMQFEELNRTLIPTLMSLNGYPEESWPHLEHGDIETPDPGAFMTALSAAVDRKLVDPMQLDVRQRAAEYLSIPQPQVTEENVPTNATVASLDGNDLAVQRLMNARKFAIESGDTRIADQLAAKIEEILARI